MSIPTFQQYQAEFCAHVRNPAGNARPAGVTIRRIKVYSDLLLNNMESTLAACFPVCKGVIGVWRWRALVKRFFAGHRSTTPLFRQIPEEFLRWLDHSDRDDLPPFFRQLAHYEWVELAVSVSDAVPGPHDPQGDLLAGRPLLAPAVMLLRYDWPVQRISPRFKPVRPLAEPLWMLVFRDAADTVQFIELNAVSARLIALIGEGNLTGAQALQQIALELQHPHPRQVAESGADLLDQFRQRGILSGTAL